MTHICRSFLQTPLSYHFTKIFAIYRKNFYIFAFFAFRERRRERERESARNERVRVSKIWQVWRPLINHPRKRTLVKVLFCRYVCAESRKCREWERDKRNIWLIWISLQFLSKTINYFFNGLFDKQSNSLLHKHRNWVLFFK